MPTRSFWRCSMPLDDLLVVLIEENVVVALVLYTNEDSVDVYRKSTHTNKYLSFSSHNPNQSKRAVVKSLLGRAKNIPSTISGQRNEQERVVKDLALNGYSSKFIQQTVQTTETPNKSDNNALGFTCIPYVRGVSEQVKRVLCNAGVRTAYKPMQSLGDIFGKPKDKQADSEIKGIVYKFECPDCPFTYIGESKRSWKSRWAEHKPGVRPEIRSAIKDHAETTGHETCMDNAKIIEKRVQNTHKRLFLESLHSVLDKRSTNEHKLFPPIYMPLVHSCNDNDTI